MPSPLRLLTVPCLAWALFACDAEFEDLRAESARGPVGPATADDATGDGAGDPGAPADGEPDRPVGAVDGDPDPGADGTGTDGDGPDGDGPGDDGPTDPDADTVVARGTWETRSNYVAGGSAELVMRADGGYEMRLSDDFETARLPGPVLVISSRGAIGGALSADAGDFELARLERLTGAQIHDIPSDPGDRRVAWIYCKPFGVEVARAFLEPVED